MAQPTPRPVPLEQTREHVIQQLEGNAQMGAEVVKLLQAAFVSLRQQATPGNPDIAFDFAAWYSHTHRISCSSSQPGSQSSWPSQPRFEQPASAPSQPPVYSLCMTS